MNGASTTTCLVAHWAAQRPGDVALRTEDGAITWADWHRRITRIEQQLAEAGIGEGARVALCLPTGVQLLSLLIALFRRGAVACPVNPQFPVAYREKLLARLDCALVIDDYHALGARDSFSETPIHWREFTSPAPLQAGGTTEPIPLSKSEQASKSIKATSTVEVPPACGGAGGVKPQRGIEAPHTKISSTHCGISTWSLDQPATIIFTSGSTGEPKAAVLSLRNHLESARASNANIPLDLEDCWLLSLPLHHVAGFGVLFRCLVAGATIAIPGSDALLRASLDGVTHVSLVARQLAQLLDAGAPLHALKAILLGGSAIPAPLIDRAFAAGLPIHTSYGMTETATQIAATPPGATRAQLASSGRPLVPDTIRIADDGRIQVSGPARFLGYWDGGAITCPFDKAGWFTTSDCGYFDDEGFLRVTGRHDNVFIAGGENIQPEEIERALCALPGITQAIVVPVSHPEFGTTPVAFVDGGEGREADMRAALAGALPRFAQPRCYFSWPTHLTGEGIKIHRAAFAALAEELIVVRRDDQ